MFGFIIKDKNINLIYHEDSNGYWFKSKYAKNNNLIYYEYSISETKIFF